MLDTSIPVQVKDLFAVSSEFRKQLRDLTTVKQVANTSTTMVQVNELSGQDLFAVNQEYGDWILRNDDGLIVAHHSLLLRVIKARVGSLGRLLKGVLDSGSKIVAMPKHIWEELGLPIQLDHTMKMLSANTNVDMTIRVLENMALDFREEEVMVQVQILARANFNLLLG